MVVGEVVELDAEGYTPGDPVHHDLGYREYALMDPGNQALGVAEAQSTLDRELGPPELKLVLLRMTGLTAWAGMFVVAFLKPDDVVWISAAAGAVGSVAAQLAKAHGCRVIGRAVSAEKVTYLKDVLGLAAYVGSDIVHRLHCRPRWFDQELVPSGDSSQSCLLRG